MSGRVKNLLLGKRDPTAHKHSNEDSQGKKHNKEPNEPPHTPRSPISPGFPPMQALQAENSLPVSQSPNPQRASSSQQSIPSSTVAQLAPLIETVPPLKASPGRRIDTEPPIQQEGNVQNLKATAGRYSPRAGAESPPENSRPSVNRSASQDGKEGNFMHRVKASRQAAQTYGGKAAKITAKATSTTAKALGEKGSKAWDKIKTKAKSSKEPQHIVPQSQYLGNFKPHRAKTKKEPIDVWGMSLREATLKTRIIKEIKSEADSAAYWTPAVTFRCLQYLNVHGPQELGLYRVSGSTAVVDEMRADFVNSHDVDISLNPPNDIHTVTSLLKGYFRALPDAILPAEIQKKVYDQCKEQPESESPPQFFIDELSQLPPYNYYMLYSLSAHLSNVNRQSDVNKMNLSNLGMIFCSTLRIDRFCFNWLVGHWADCWQGCWTERDELEKTDPELWNKQRDNASTMSSPAPTFDTRSSAPSSPAPGSTAPNTPIPPCVLSQDTPAQSPQIVQSPQGAQTIQSPQIIQTVQSPQIVQTVQSPQIAQTAQSPQIAQTAQSPQTAQTVLSVQSPQLAAASPVSNASVSDTTSHTGHSVPPTPRSPCDIQSSIPTTPYTPASFIMGDDQRMMVHSASDIIADYVDGPDEEDQPVLTYSKGKQKRRLITDEEKSLSSKKSVDLPPVVENDELSKPSPTSKEELVTLEPLKIEKKSEPPQQPELRLEGQVLASSPDFGTIQSEAQKPTGSRPPNIKLPSPPHLDVQKSSTLPVGLQLMLPPLTPMSPLIATMDHGKSG